MKLNVIGGVIAVLAFAALIVGYSSLFTVYQTQNSNLSLPKITSAHIDDVVRTKWGW